jgi:membrane protein
MIERVEAVYLSLVRRPATPAPLRTALTGVAILLREMLRDQLHVRAATLSYWSLVGLVPALVLVAAAMTPFGGQDAVRELLYRTLLAGPVRAVGTQLDTWLAAVDFASLGVAGLVGVAITASRIYFSVEEAYNRLWNVTERRSIAMRVVIFYAALTLVPVLIAYGFHLTGQLRTGVDISLLYRAAPALLTGFAFAGAIKALPDTDVRWVPALVGGGCSAVLFEIAKSGFGAYTDLLGTTDAASAVYGSLALFPIFLLWLYVLWWIVLFGVELAYVTQRFPDLQAAELRRHAHEGLAGRHADVFFALRCLSGVVEAYASGNGAVAERDVSRSLGADPVHVRFALETLESIGLLAECPTGYLPARPPEQVSVEEAVRLYRARTRPASAVDDDAVLALRLLSAGGSVAVAALPRLLAAEQVG